jgi:membrane protein DedA with SNARE-associated domain
VNEPLVPAELLILIGVLVASLGVLVVFGPGYALIVLGAALAAAGAVAWWTEVPLTEQASA